MNKGIFQSGSLRSCEKQSDIFHHIRYANTPRSVVPHKSMEVPKSLITLEDYRQAELNLEKKLKSEGYGTSRQTVHKVAKGIKFFFFVLFYIPFYIVFRLPFAVLSIVLSQLARGVRAILKPLLKALDTTVNTIKSLYSRINFSGFRWKFSFDRTKSVKQNEAKTVARDWKFWKSWKLPEWKMTLPKLKLPQISLFLPWNRIKFSRPQWNWNWKPKFSFTKFRGFSWVRVNFPKGDWLNFQLPKWGSLKWKFSWQLPKFNMNWTLRWPTISFPWKLQWNISPILEKWKEKLNRLRFWKREKKKRDSYIRATAKAFGVRFLDGLDSYVSELPSIPQMILRGIGRLISLIVIKLYTLVSRVVLGIWNVVLKGYRAAVKVRENIQKVHAWTQKATEQTQKWVDSGVEAVARPVVRVIESAHSKTIPIRLRFRRWTFLAGIVVELSLVLLNETILEFQEWNNVRWISKFQ